MCGIVAYIGSREATPILMEGLKRLEYRGYDSAGIAIVNGGMAILRSVGRVSVLEEKLTREGHLYGVHGKALERRCEAALDLAGLQQHADSLVRTFSGGMKRRINLAIGLLHEPKLLILDLNGLKTGSGSV